MPRSDINFNSGFTGCNDRMAILKNSTVPRRLDEFPEVDSTEMGLDMYVYVDDNGTDKKMSLGDITNPGAMQSDWESTDEESYAYIKNKPDLKLKEDLTSLYEVGGVRVGQVFPENTSLYDILIDILSTTKDAILYFGLVDEIPASWTISDIDALNQIEAKAADLIAVGTNPKYTTFDANNQYYVLAVPKEYGIKVSEVSQNGFLLDFISLNDDVYHKLPSKLDDSIKDSWDIYLPVVTVFDTPKEFARTTGKFTVIYKFKEV